MPINELAGLRYTTGAEPGLRRVKSGKQFRYVNAKGKTVRDAATLKRIRSLVLPPAWTDVWICAQANGHLQATGYDARGRKQYRYHPQWRAARDRTKYHKMISFGAALPRIRERVTADLSRAKLPKEKVVAAVVRLLDETHIRIGNEEYAKENHSYGLTTLKGSQVQVRGANLRFRFRGKSGKDHDIAVSDKRVARVVQRCQELPGHELFEYIDDRGAAQDVASDDVNAYLQDIAGDQFTAKDFRTWAGTVQAALTLEKFPACKNQTEAKRNVSQAIKCVSSVLGNTPAVCRKCYVHPFILDAYLDQSLPGLWKKHAKRVRTPHQLTVGEAIVLCLLRRG